MENYRMQLAKKRFGQILWEEWLEYVRSQPHLVGDPAVEEPARGTKRTLPTAAAGSSETPSAEAERAYDGSVRMLFYDGDLDSGLLDLPENIDWPAAATTARTELVSVVELSCVEYVVSLSQCLTSASVTGICANTVSGSGYCK